MALLKRNKSEPAAEPAAAALAADDQFQKAIDAQINAKSAERSKALDEAGRVESEAELGELPTEDAYSKLKFRASQARKRADEAARSIQALEQLRSSPFAAEMREKIQRHAKAIADAVSANDLALWRAASTNADVINAVAAARAELSDEIAMTFVSPQDLVYNGLVREDLAARYSTYVKRILSSFPGGTSRALQKAIDARVRTVTARQSTAPAPRPLWTPPTAPRVARPAVAAERSLSADPPAITHAPALPDEPGPLADGHVWVRVIIPGHPDRDGRQCQRGRRIQKPSAEAHAAVLNGAVEMDPDPPTMQEAE
jgi:hypothetical protein